MGIEDVGSLNRLEIRRFAAISIQTFGGEVDRYSPDIWRVTLPPALSNLAESRDVTAVFDPKDQKPGREEIIIQPGSLAFNELLRLVKQDVSVGKLHLSAVNMQIHSPKAIDVSSLSVTIEEFTPEQTAEAISFHFVVEMESVSSFHQERFETVTLDLANGDLQPELTQRLLSHTGSLTQTYQTASLRPGSGVVKKRYQAAVGEVERRIDTDVTDLLSEATDAAETRVKEIRDLYDQRRDEVNKELYGSARRQRKKALNEQESGEITETINRYDVNVNISLIGITVISHDFGELRLTLCDGERTGETTFQYAPATGDTIDFSCTICDMNFSNKERPQICDCGSVICSECLGCCLECGVNGCPNCETPVVTCELCGRRECRDCGALCNECNRSVCSYHTEVCSETEDTVCLACGQSCTTCGTFHGDRSLNQCRVDEELHCESHIDQCAVGDELLCPKHSHRDPISNKYVCTEHAESCDTCKQLFVSTTLDNGICETCTDLSSNKAIETEVRSQLPDEVSFRSMKIGANDMYVVVLGKRLIRSNEVIILDRDTTETVARYSVGILTQLSRGWL